METNRVTCLSARSPNCQANSTSMMREKEFRANDKHMGRLRCLPLLLGGVKSLTRSSGRVYHSTRSIGQLSVG